MSEELEHMLEQLDIKLNPPPDDDYEQDYDWDEEDETEPD